MNLLTLTVDGLAGYRITRLLVEDTILDRPREALRSKLLATAPSDRDRPGHPKLAELLTCPWCMSMYVATGVVLARRFAPRTWQPVATVLALSAITGQLASHE